VKPSPSRSSTPEAPWRAGLRGVRALFVPGLVLQTAAVGVVLAYYFVPATAGVFNHLAHWQSAGGFAFSAATTALCGGLLPFLFMRLDPATRARSPWPHLGFFVLFWAWKGVEVDFWYRTLAWLYGTDPGVGTIVRKVVTDQFIYNPLYASPVGNLFFAWKDAGFRWAPVFADVRAGRWYQRSVLPVLLAVWSLWIPVTACIYALPSPLQMPLFNIVLCFWSMLFSHIVAQQNQATSGNL
jgi:hypothetical protein